MCESEIGIRYSCLLAQTHWFLRHIVLVSQTGVLCNDAIRNGLNCNDILLLLWEINWLEKVKTVDIYILCSYVKQILWLSKFPSSSDRIALEKLGKKYFWSTLFGVEVCFFIVNGSFTVRWEHDMENSEQQQEHKSGEAVLRNIKAWNLELWLYSKWYYWICGYIFTFSYLENSMVKAFQKVFFSD